MRGMVLAGALALCSCAALMTALELYQAFAPALTETLRAVMDQWGDNPDVVKAVSKVNAAAVTLKGLADASTATDDQVFLDAVADMRDALEALFEITIPMGLHPHMPAPGEPRFGVARDGAGGVHVPSVDALMYGLEHPG